MLGPNLERIACISTEKICCDHTNGHTQAAKLRCDSNLSKCGLVLKRHQSRTGSAEKELFEEQEKIAEAMIEVLKKDKELWKKKRENCKKEMVFWEETTE